MTRFRLGKDTEVSGLYANGEEWRVKTDASGNVDVKDDAITAALEAAGHEPVKAKEKE